MNDTHLNYVRNKAKIIKSNNFVYCILMKMRGNFLLDAVMLSGTEANNSQTCSVEV
jgi:hypothetical protein